MALNRIQTDAIEDDAITTDKILDGTVGPADIGDGELTNTQINASAAIALTKISGLGTAATLDFGTGANQILQLDGSGNLPALNASALTNLDSADLSGNLPALNGSNLTNLTAANLTGALPAISGANLTGVSTDTSAMENNIAILAFKVQSANDLAKFNLVDQVIDEYKDDTGLGTQTDIDRSGSSATDGYMASVYAIHGTPAYVTGDRTSTITATHSGFSWSGGTTSNLVDGDMSTNTTGSTYFQASTPSAGSYIRFQFSTAQLITEAKWYSDAGASSGSYGIWQWQGSNNASSWTNIGANTFLASGTSFTHLTLNGNTSAYTYYQLLYVSGSTIASHWQKEVEFKQASSTSTANAAGSLISTANTALTAPTTGDIVLLIEEVDGVVATLNTAGNDLRCAISRNGGTGWDYVALENKGLWGTNKKILVANGVPFSNSASGTDMRYKLEWANQAEAVAAGDTDHSTTTGWAESGNIALLFDNNNATWPVTGGGNPQWFTTDLGTAKVITKYTMTSWTGSSNASPASWDIKGSNDTTNGNNGTWSSALDTKTGQSVWGSNEKRSFTFSNSTAYRYWKISMTATNTGHAPELAEMEYITTSSGTAARIVKVHATSLAWA